MDTLTLPNEDVVTYQYDTAGNLTRVDYPNGTFTAYVYDVRNRLVSLSNEKTAGGVISQYAYQLDATGNRTDVSREEPLGPTPNPGSVSYTYAAGNLLTSFDGTTCAYDGNGNLTSKAQGASTTTYTYDAPNRLAQVSSPSGTVTYQYDALGNRVAKTQGGTTVRYLVDPNGTLPRVIAELDGSGSLTSYYVYDAFGLVAKIVGAELYYYHFDGLGSTIALTDANGAIVNKYAYDAFGNLLAVEEAVPNPFRYVGRYGVMHEDYGLLYMRARFYDPEVGRFTAKDPIGYGGGDFNLYTYVGNNTLNWVDPSGLSFLYFYRKSGIIVIYSRKGKITGVFPARNKPVGGVSKLWPIGSFPFLGYYAHPENSSVCGSLGTYGFFHFHVPGRTEMGVHSGRDCPQFKRRGIEHPTRGCIRTTDAAMQFLKALHQQDPLTLLQVEEDYPLW